MIFCYVAAFCALLLYLHAFFPLSPKITSVVEAPKELYDIKLDVNYSMTPEFDRLIFVIIDALRLDFVTDENMPFLVKKFSENGCFLSVKVESPTVTLPRIKALTSGGVPQFIDIVLNLIQTEVMEDSYLHRAVAKNKHLVFYGDDTWLKLYPHLFMRSEGTSSFYVNDFSEVDDNVTRNVNVELKKDDWDMMFLHYLGLDHIGHVLGPYSSLIKNKLLEMDQIVENIYEKIEKMEGKSLIVVTGDHGMKDSGGHGGATFAETNVPFILLNHNCKNDSVAQTDIAATLSVLLGLEIPISSIGRLVKNVLRDFSFEKLLYVLRYNALLLRSKSNAYNEIFENASNIHYQYLKSNETKTAKNAIDLYDKYSFLTSNDLIKSSVHQNILLLIVSICLLMLCFTTCLHLLLNETKSSTFYKTISFTTLFLGIISQIVTTKNIVTSVTLITAITVVVFFNLVMVKKHVRYKNNNFTLLVFGFALHALTLFSSSFIEEEHQYWYFFAGTFILMNACNDLTSWLVIFIGLRFVRTINQTGDKWASSPDLALWFLQPENQLFLMLFLIASLILVFACLNRKFKFVAVFNCLILVLIYMLKSSSTQNINLGKLLWFLILVYFVISVITRIPLVNTWILICTLLVRSYNVILIPFSVFVSLLMQEKIEDTNVLILSHILFGNVLFFCQGHSNSIASVNIASGFIGLQHYNPFLVIGQVLCHTYAFPVLLHFLLLQNKKVNRTKAWYFILAYRMYILTVVCILTVLFRHHLFVWTVFAPKLLIESMHFVITLTEFVISIFYNKLSR